ncbi:MAG TPA: hypothetical protein VK179_16615 [Bacteroidales bacterium]|nr:hypothetical protein [Bacteroidales bacterium]
MKTQKMLSGLFLFVIMATFPYVLKAQETTEKKSMIYPTLGVGLGFFYPSDVNKYVETVIASGYDYTVNTQIYMYVEVKGGLTFRIKKADFTAALEYDIAPKYIAVTNGSSFSYTYSRVAPEITANYYLPNKSGKNAFLIGGGISYSFIKFKEFTGSAPGFKIQAGYSMQFSKINIQPYFAFRYVQAVDNNISAGYKENQTSFDLSYTGGQIGIILSFHSRMLYR